MKFWAPLIVVLAVLAGSSAASASNRRPSDPALAEIAQPPLDSPGNADDNSPREGDELPPTGPGDPNGMPPRQRRFEQFRLMKMLELLDLTDAQEAPFMTAYHDMRKQNDKLESDKRAAVESLSRSLRSRRPDTANINNLIDQLVSLEQQRRDVNKHFLDTTRQILSAEQVGRLVLFVERFDSTVFQRLQAMRQRMRGPQGRPPRPDSGDGDDH